MNTERKLILIRSVVLCVITGLILFGGLKFVDRYQQQQYQEKRGTGTDEFMQSNVVIREDGKYRKTPAVTTILIAGIDRDPNEQEGVSTSRYRSGGQADFLLLLAVDHTHRQIHQLQIDRDTMTEMTVLSVFGVETGTRVQQICLSHAFGANKEENARYTVRAVRNLMDDLEINGYYMVDYSAVTVINEMLGGITVTVPVDMTGVNPLWSEGATITLYGSDAEQFVRTRQTVGEGTNAERMVRQNEFMRNAIQKLNERISKDSGFAAQLLNSLKRYAATDLSDQQLLEEIRNSSNYEVLEVKYLDGEYKTGETGYVEFHVNDDSAENWILEHLYTRID